MSSRSTDAKKRCESCLKYVEIYITCFKCDAAYHIYCWKRVPGAYVNERGQLFCCGSLTSNYARTNSNLETQDDSPERMIEKGNVDGDKEDFENHLIKQEDSEWNEFKCDACHLEFTNKEYLENHYSECLNKEGGFIPELIKEDKDLEHYLHKEEDLEWSEFRCGACLLELTNKEHLMNHYSECPNKEGEFIEKLNEDKDLETHLPKEGNSEPNKRRLEDHCTQSPNKQGKCVPGLSKDKAGLFNSVCNEEDFQNESYEQHVKQCEVEGGYSRLNESNNVCITNTKRYPAQVNDEENEYKRKRTRIRTNEKPFKCNMCDYVAARKQRLKSHVLSKHYKAYKCRHCKYSSDTKTTLVRHIRTHTNEKPFKCDMCEFAAARKSKLKSHILARHSNADKRYKCGDCKYSTHRKTDLINHIRTHTNTRPFKCDTCDYAAIWRDNLKRHVLVKHSNADKEYKCRDCEYSTHTRTSLVDHIRTHTNEKPFKCDMCDYAAAQKSKLKNHVLAKHSNGDKEYKCRECQYSTHKKADLIHHIRSHTNEKPFKCDMCDYAAARKQVLKDHVLAKHSSADKQYKCRDCEYSTHKNASLIYHVRTHTNEKPFKCEACDYAAARKQVLKRHVLAKHSNTDKEYKCKDCEYSTYTRMSLVNHICIRTDERQQLRSYTYLIRFS